MDWEPGTGNLCVWGQAILSLLLAWTGWPCPGHMAEGDEEEEALLLLCWGFSATATRMLIMCTWKYMDLETTGNGATVRITRRTGHTPRVCVELRGVSLAN